MTVLKIISLLLGITFLILGYLIFFRKKYSLINGYEEEYKKGLKDEEYARRVGVVELTAGIALLIVSALIFVFL